MTRENKEREEKNAMVFDEDLEAYFTVNANVVKIVQVPGQKKSKVVSPVLFSGENVRCDGNYTVVDGAKYLYVQSRDKKGFVPETALTKL